jgi:hypothetical protein
MPLARTSTRATGRVSRSRWAAVGAAIAVSLGAGGILTTSASIGSGERGVYVPIAPCRVFDTRPGGDNVGPRQTPLGPGDTFVATVRGTNGNCTIPTDAVGVVMNVAIVNPSSASFLTVYPADVARPLAANANWVAGQPPLSNAVTADISADGKIAFYNLAGTVDVAADIVGYYVDHTHDDRYYTKLQVDTLAHTGGTRVVLAGVGDGLSSSLTIGTDGLPVVAYNVLGPGGLRVAKCANTGCTGVTTITTVDSDTGVGDYNSIAIGTDGNPVIAYYDSSNHRLKVAKCANPACTGPATITTAEAGNVGAFPSIAIGADSLPVISYYDLGNHHLKVAKCINTACTGTPGITTVDSSVNVGQFTSIKVAANGNPIISYYDNANGDLKVAACANPGCTGTATTTAVDTAGNVGEYSSLAIGTDGLAIIADYDFVNKDLRVTHCVNSTCTGVSISTTIDSTGDVGQWASMGISPSGLPVIAYFDGANGDLKFAACGTIDCTGSASIVTLDTAGNIGVAASLAVGADGLPIISHNDTTNGNLRVTKCATVTCTS